MITLNRKFTQDAVITIYFVNYTREILLYYKGTYLNKCSLLLGDASFNKIEILIINDDNKNTKQQ